MKIGFFGTPEIAAYYLDRLCKAHDVSFAVTGEDKPVGRHGTPVFSAVKKIALKNNIRVFQPSSLLDNGFLKQITDKNADIFVVIAYGKILPLQIFNLPRLRTVNVHPSLLPKYRGAAPIQWALINGEKESGITIQYINEMLDAGEILSQKKIPLGIDMSAEDLFNIVLPSGFDLLNEALDILVSGKANPVKQNDAEATYCGKINRETARIDWNNSSEEIHNLVRGLNPKPVAWTEFKGKIIKIFKTRLLPVDFYESAKKNINLEYKPGFIAGYQKRLLAGTGNGFVEILSLQPETKKTMDGSSFINGYRPAPCDSFKVF
jgi:methionyl-tRNA formyltransferase